MARDASSKDTHATANKLSTGQISFKSLTRFFQGIPNSVIWTSLAINVLGLALPLVALQIYDRIIPNNATGTLAILVLGLGLVIIADTIMKIARSYLLGWESAKLGCAINIDASDRMLNTRRDIIASEKPTTWMDRLDALAEVNAASSVPARIALIDILFVPVYLLLFATVGGILVLIPILVLAPVLYLTLQRGDVLRARLSDRASQDRQRHDFLIESLNGIQVVKAMAMEPQMQRRYERLQRHSAEINFDVILLSQSIQSLATLISSITTIGVVTSGALLIIGGSNITIGGLACCSLLSGRLMQPIMKGVGVWSQYQSRAVSKARAAPIHALPAPHEQQAASTQCQGRIELTGINYSDYASGSPVLRDINLTIEAKETIAFRPTDNIAKDAFLGLIHGDFPPTSGKISIDGLPFNEAETENGEASSSTASGFRSQIAMVSNDSDILAGTILENLTMFGGPQAIARVRHYSQAIGLENAINLLPDGYDTMVGEAVVNQLPLGLVQQIAIVRALACDPAILIIDEAYTSLDSTADPAVIKVLASMKGQRTILIAAHRPSYLKLADRQFEIKDDTLQAFSGAPQPNRPQNTGPGAQANSGMVA